MAWHRIDYDGLWSSDKLNLCSDDAQADYVWVYGIADAHGCLELTNQRVVHGKVAAIRKKLSLERPERDFEEYRTNGLCFTWQEAGKRYGYWTGCESRLPPISVRNRYTRSTPAPPQEHLEEYVRSFGGTVPQSVELQPEGEQSAQPQAQSQPREANLDAVATTSRLDRDNGNGTGTGTETETERQPTHRLSRPAAEARAIGPQLTEFQFEGEPPAQPQPESHPREENRGLNPRVLLEIYEQARGPLPAVRAETPERLNKCRKRLLIHTKSQEQFLADFRAAVRKASQIAWPAWRPPFDWFIGNDTNYSKVLEGNYDHWGNSTAGNKQNRNSGHDFSRTDRAAENFLRRVDEVAPKVGPPVLTRSA